MHKKVEHQHKSLLLAVSGGVDSMALLFATSKVLSNSSTDASYVEQYLQHFYTGNPVSRIEACYIDHGQRDDTSTDLQVLQKITKQFGINLHIKKLTLPPNCSEESARKERYKALEEVRSQNELDYITTAHHADDLIETALINLTRGTGLKGLSSLAHDSEKIWRPFLAQLDQKKYIYKTDLISYLQKNKVVWSEDSTNQSTKYLRNRIRKNTLHLDERTKAEVLASLTKSSTVKLALEEELRLLEDSLQISKDPPTYSKKLFMDLDSKTQRSFLHQKLSELSKDVSQKSVSLAQEFIATKTTGKTLQLKKCHIYFPDKNSFSFLQKVL